jgi:outer membrane protein assembly factor BamE
MNRQNSSHGFPRAAVAVLLLIAAAMGGCVHRPYIQQGNYLETTDVDQVTSGMTRSQVRYLLGTPMISDPFTAQRWDYIYTLKRGRDRNLDRAHFVVYFVDDKVSRVERLDSPEPNRGIETGLPEVERTEQEMAGTAERDADDDEADRQPEPEAPRPDGG